MQQHTLIFDTDVGENDVELYEKCAGVVGVAGFANTITLHYAQSVTERELESLAHAVMRHAKHGVHLQYADIDVVGDERITTEFVKSYLVY